MGACTDDDVARETSADDTTVVDLKIQYRQSVESQTETILPKRRNKESFHDFLNVSQGTKFVCPKNNTLWGFPKFCCQATTMVCSTPSPFLRLGWKKDGV
jgi:hypothetical protein